LPGKEDAVNVIPAVLGWSNPDTKETSNRLYATDIDRSPRWAPDGGRTIERAIDATASSYEGDRYLIVHVGDRFVTDERMAELTAAIEKLLASVPAGSTP
jgi:hypothetical protein